MNHEDNHNEDNPAAFLGSSSSAKTMADGSLRLTIDLSPADAIGAFIAFGAPGSAVAIARIENTAAVEADRPKDVSNLKPWGQSARALFQSSFFRNPDVWKAIGTDKEYLEWIRLQASAKSGIKHHDRDTGKEGCVAAHVRRVQHGSGTAIKPLYSAIPLTYHEHHECHQQGDSYAGDEEWWEKKRIQYLHEWCWLTAKDQIQSDNPDIECDSFGSIPPKLVLGWAMRRGIEKFLPNAYKGHVNGEITESDEAGEA